MGIDLVVYGTPVLRVVRGFSRYTSRRIWVHSQSVITGRSPFAWLQTALSQFGVREVMFDRRRETRRASRGELAITWREYGAAAHHARVQMVNCSEHGAAFRGSDQIPPGRIIGIRRGDGICRAIVRHSRAVGPEFITGVELCETYRVPLAATHLELN